MRTLINLPDDDQLLATEELARLLGLSAGTVANRASRGAPLPDAIKIGRRRYYTGRAIRAWIEGGDAAGPAESVRCPTCGFAARSAGGLAVHRRRRHGEGA